MTAYLPPFIALLIAAGVFIGYIHPTYTKDIGALKSDIENYDRALAAATDYLSKQEEIAEKRNALTKQDVERLKAFLPDGVDNVQLILDLNQLASKTGLALSDIDVKASTAPTRSANALAPAPSPQERIQISGEGPIDSVDLDIKFTGTYDRLFAFLTAVESSLRPLDVTALTVQKASAESTVYSFTMTLRVYWLR